MRMEYSQIQISKDKYRDAVFHIADLDGEFQGTVMKKDGVTVFYPDEYMCKDLPISLAAMEDIVSFMREFTLHNCFPQKE